MRPGPSERFIAFAAGAAVLSGGGVLVATLLPWYEVTSAVRPGVTIELVATMWRADDGSDPLLVVAALAGIALCALTVAACLAGRPRLPVAHLSAAGAGAFTLCLWLVFIRVIEPPDGADLDLRWGALAALVLAALALTWSVVAALAARARAPG
jgi:hypothetical protein